MNIFLGNYRHSRVMDAAILATIIFFLSDCYPNHRVFAQIVPDATLGSESSTVDSEGNIEGLPSDLIEGGAVRGANLFHSFKEFNINEGRGAYFNNPSNIETIFSRVTGNNSSQILGKLGVLGNADLFLINPNGIIFGANSSLDLNGSFVATTAASVLFEDNTQFGSIGNSERPLLTVSVPVGLQFGMDAGQIVNRSQALDPISGFPVGLQLQPGNTLALVGSGINFQGGSVLVPDGNVELGSVADDETVDLQQSETGWTLGYQNVQNFQDIDLNQDLIAVEIPFPIVSNFVPSFIDAGGEEGGNIRAQGRRITLADGSQLGTNQVGASVGSITINASKTLEIRGISGNVGSLEFPVFISSALVGATASEQDAGNITVNTNRLIVRDEGRINTRSSFSFNEQFEIDFATGDGGDLIINASSIELTGDESGFFSGTDGFGDGGNIVINTDRLVVEDGAEISTASVGVDPFSGEPLATGEAGDISINASESITVDRGLITSETGGAGGDAGELQLSANQLLVRDGGQVSVSANGSGAAGNLEIMADLVTLNGGLLSAETQTGTQGNIFLNANNIFLNNQSQIITDTDNSTGGNIVIDTDILAAANNSDITANAQEGTGGQVTVRAEGIFGIEARTRLTPLSDITATSELGTEFAGEVVLQTPDVDPTSGVVKLSDVPVDAETLFARNPCTFRDDRIAGGSSFIITGRGGLPPSIQDPLVNSNRVVNWASSPEQISSDGSVVLVKRSPVARKAIKQARGWVVSHDGSIYLTAPVSQDLGIEHPTCSSKANKIDSQK